MLGAALREGLVGSGQGRKGRHRQLAAKRSPPLVSLDDAALLVWMTKKRLEIFHELQHAGIFNPVVNKICFFAAGDDPLVAEDGQVLGNIAIRRLHGCLNIPNRQLFAAEQAEYLEADGVGHGFKELGQIVYLFGMHIFPVALF
jgi:hypothetical protein